jgi:hypothetical protein
MIRVGLRWEPGAQYIGRPSPLGNPFRMATEAERDVVCDRYARWFQQRIDADDARVMDELRRLYRWHREHGELVLGCYCAPRRCHGDTIKAYLERFAAPLSPAP